ncbi:MAG: hypothetical protein WCQ53_00190 [bacterium]
MVRKLAVNKLILGSLFLFISSCAVHTQIDIEARKEKASINPSAPVTGNVYFSQAYGKAPTIVTWDQASDDITLPANLMYKVVKASSAEAIDTVEKADAIEGSDLLMDWTANTTTLSVSGLVPETTYYFAVIAKDEDGNKALYWNQGWEAVGSTIPGAQSISIAMGPDKKPYVTYVKFTDPSDATIYVQKLEKSSWVSAADTITGMRAQRVSLAVDADKTIYTGHLEFDAAGNTTAFVEKMGASGWSIVGKEIPGAKNICVAVDTDKKVYRASSMPDASKNYTTTIETMSSSAWKVIGKTIPEAQILSMAISADNIPYVAYLQNSAAAAKTVSTLVKMGASKWVTVGDPITDAKVMSIALDADKNPYIAYTKPYKVNNGQVKGVAIAGVTGLAGFIDVLGPSGWSTIGEPLLNVQNISVAIDADNVPYRAYTEVVGSNAKSFISSSKIMAAVKNTIGIVERVAPAIPYFTTKIVDTTPPVGARVSFSQAKVSDPVTVTWEAASDDISPVEKLQYKVVATTAGVLNTIAKADSLTGTKIKMDWKENTTSVDVSGLSANTIYYFAVLVRDEDGNEALYPGGWTPVGVEGISAGSSEYTSLALDSSNVPYVVFQDAANDNKATVMKFNGASWEPVGSSGFSAGQIAETAIAFDRKNVLYVAYIDSFNAGRVTAMKFDGSSWVPVGVPGFTSQATNVNMAIDSNNVPYVVYKDGWNNNQATVMKFNGDNWTLVGIAASAGVATNYPSIAIDSNNVPYVAYSDWSQGGRITVKRFDGNSWAIVGWTGISTGQGDFVSLALDSNNLPYVAYLDIGYNSSSSVMKFDGNNWGYVGSQGFSGNWANWTSLALDSNGVPYLAFMDGANNYGATGMKFDGSSWIALGTRGFSVGQAVYTSLRMSSNDDPYIAYKDTGNGGKATVVMYNGLMRFKTLSNEMNLKR